MIKFRCLLRLAAVSVVGLAPQGPASCNEGRKSVGPPSTLVEKSDASAPQPSDAHQSWDASVQEYLGAQLAKHRIPGASLAVAREGKVVYQWCFGYADVESKTLVAPDHRFRIASLSKPLTATGVLRLVESGKLRLDDCLLPLLKGSECLPEQGALSDGRLKDITVRLLLQHRAGWDREVSGDPMFQSALVARAFGKRPPASQADTIRYMLKRPLDFTPGERYCYSNFGYLLLGRLIEHVSGQDYASYVQEEVLSAAGVTDMQIGSSLPRQSAPREVKYYDPGVGPSVFDADSETMVPEPYGVWNLEAMDAHGGWIATASDLAKYASTFYADAASSPLSVESLAATVERPPGAAGYDEHGAPTNGYYGLGWKVLSGEGGAWTHLTHLGSLPGTSTMLICQRDGVCYALLCNARKSPHSDHFSESIFYELVELMQRTRWPSSSETPASVDP